MTGTERVDRAIVWIGRFAGQSARATPRARLLAYRAVRRGDFLTAYDATDNTSEEVPHAEQ